MRKHLFIISRYNEDISWINEYSDNYIVYNKGCDITGFKNVQNTENIGSNQKDIFKYICDNYYNLPELMVFLQGFPFDHCCKEVFDVLIKNEKFTPLEYYGKVPANSYENRDENGGFMEINNSWYINAHCSATNQTCKYSSFDEFMNTYFTDYNHLNWVRFSPGSQYIVEKEQIEFYPLFFWENLNNELTKISSTEGQVIERALYYIFNNTYKIKEIKNE